MNQTLSLGWTQAEARSRKLTYQRILRVTLAAEAVIGLAALVAPGWFSSLFAMPTVEEIPASTAWARSWGLLLVLFAVFQVPALREPIRHRFGNVVGIVGRILLGLFYLLMGASAATGLLWLALLEGGLGVALVILYFGLFRAELMSRP